jgi:hypothetical protein
MIDCFGFCVNQQLAQSGIVPEKPIIGETVKPEAVIVKGTDRFSIRYPAEGGRGNRDARDRALEHRGEPADLVRAALNVLDQTLIPQI